MYIGQTHVRKNNQSQRKCEGFHDIFVQLDRRIYTRLAALIGPSFLHHFRRLPTIRRSSSLPRAGNTIIIIIITIIAIIINIMRNKAVYAKQEYHLLNGDTRK